MDNVQIEASPCAEENVKILIIADIISDMAGCMMRIVEVRLPKLIQNFMESNLYDTLTGIVTDYHHHNLLIEAIQDYLWSVGSSKLLENDLNSTNGALCTLSEQGKIIQN